MLGHEGAGTVEAIGPGVEELEREERIAPALRDALRDRFVVERQRRLQERLRLLLRQRLQVE